MFGPLFEGEMSRKCTPLWREAHFQVKSVKKSQVHSILWHSDVVLRGICKGSCTLPKVSQTWRPCSSFNYNYTLHYTTLHYTTPHYTALQCTPLHSTTLNYTIPRYNYSYITQHWTDYIPLGYLQLTTLHYLQLHCTTLRYTALHYYSTSKTTTNTHATTLHYVKTG